MKYFTATGMLVALLVVGNAAAAGFRGTPQPLFPIVPVIADRHVEEIYPSIAGDHLVYTVRDRVGKSRVLHVSASRPQVLKGEIKPTWLNEVISSGVAVADGSIGYISNRVGPISAWMKESHGDAHVAIGGMVVFRGALVPHNLSSSADGRVWCFDATLEKVRHSEMLQEYTKPRHWELLGQNWRIYHSELFRHKLGYPRTQTGMRNKFAPPALFIYNRTSGVLKMIPNAQNGSISPDGRRVVFSREINGNYDLWMQDVDGGQLVQLTSSDYGEFEPAWSPDGSKIAFVSNRDSKGSVRHTSIYVMDLKNGRIQRVTNAPKATDGGPTWKDGHTILFHSNRDPARPQTATVEDWNIWQVDFQGGF